LQAFGKLAVAETLYEQCVVAKHKLSQRRAIRQADIAADAAEAQLHKQL